MHTLRAGAAADIDALEHTSAYVSIRQHTSVYVSIRQHTLRSEAAADIDALEPVRHLLLHLLRVIES